MIQNNMPLFSGQKVVADIGLFLTLVNHIPFAFSQQCVNWLVLFVCLLAFLT